MSIRVKFILGFLFIFITGFYFLVDFIVNEIRPRYLETVEESMNDTAHLLASLVEDQISGGVIRTDLLRSMFTGAFKKKFRARIYGFEKTGIQLNVYVADKKGTVIFDSDDGKKEGKDFSRWNDVYRTLRGEYGARSTPVNPKDPATDDLYVAAPIKHGDSIIGVLTVVKPEQSVDVFVSLARKKIIIAGVLLCLIFILLSLALSFWINRPILMLTGYVNALKEHRRAVLPKLTGREIRALGLAFEDMKNELDGKKYTEHYVQALTHELKSPLSSIIGSAELLTENMEENQRERFSRLILRESRRILRIIDRLLQLSSLENRAALKDIQDLNLVELMKEIVESQAPLIRKRLLHVTSTIREDLSIRGERFLVYHSLMNILVNAIQFSPVRGAISINAERKNNLIDITFRDEGSGIPDYATEKIFEKFFSLPPESGQKKGTGLGLAFVKEAVSIHGGEIVIMNNEIRGVTARLSFPAAH